MTYPTRYHWQCILQFFVFKTVAVRHTGSLKFDFCPAHRYGRPTCISKPNFIEFGQPVFEISRFSDIQDRGRPPSLILVMFKFYCSLSSEARDVWGDNSVSAARRTIKTVLHWGSRSDRPSSCVTTPTRVGLHRCRCRYLDRVMPHASPRWRAADDVTTKTH